jgi:tetratricopeptide (TPR) repeat protein
VELVESIERSRELQRDGRHEEALQVLLDASREHQDEGLDLEIAAFYAERGWAQAEDAELAAYVTDGWAGLARSNGRARADFEESLTWMELPQALAGLGSAESLDRVLEREPAFALAAVLRGRLHLAAGDVAAAGERMMQAAQTAPDYPPAWAGLAEALAKAGRADEAVGALEEGLRHCPASDALWVRLARALGPEGRAAWIRATEINRLNADAWRGRAQAAADDGDEVEAARCLDRAAALDAAPPQ